MRYTGMVAVFLATVAVAEAREDGFSAGVGVGVLVVNQADNLNGRGPARINSLQEKPASFTRGLPVPLLELRYAWAGQSVTFGSSVDEPTGITLGYRRKLTTGALSGSAFYSFWGREWQDPYLVAVDRQDTRVDTFGGRVTFEEIAGTPVSLAVKGTVKQVANEGLPGDLRRDGARLDLDLSWRQRLGNGWTVTPAVGYQRGEYEGAANNFHGASLGVGVSWRSTDLLLTVKTSGTYAGYDRSHPRFAASRRDLGYSLSTFARWDNPFGWSQYYGLAGIVHQQADSSIDFFATRSLVGFAGFGYQF